MVVKKVVMKKKKRMEREVKLILGGIGAIALLLAGIIVVLSIDFSEEPAKETEPEKHPNLFIDEVRFVNSDANTRSNTDDATSKNVELEIYAMVTDTNMGEDSEEVKVGDVPSMKTKKAAFTLDLPVGEEYKIDLLVFEDGMITKKGYGTVKLEEETDATAQQFKTTEDGRKNWNSTESDDDNDDKEKKADEAEESALGIMIFFLIFAIIFVIVVSSIWASRRMKNK